MQHAAWLAAVPSEQTMKGKVFHLSQTLTRRERFEADGVRIEMPPVDAAAHLLDVLWQIGPSMPIGMGSSSITFGEIQAWQQQTGFELTAWEVKTLRRMSISYVDQAERSRKLDCPAPWIAPSARRNRVKKSRDIRAFLRD